MFKPKRDYSVKKDRTMLIRRLKYVIGGVVVFLLGFIAAGPIMGLFR